VTTNEGKFREVSRMLADAGIETEMVDLDYLEIQSDKLEEVVQNALDWLSGKVEGDFLIDDSGLFVSSLGGFPGVHSSYVFDTIGREGVIKLLEGVEDRYAQFVCCFGLHWMNDDFLFKGSVVGAIADIERGDNGFGFDPIFIPSGGDKTFAEISLEEKNRLSHRRKAMDKVLEYLETM
jgi:XTP/dITP diphosphohydrolase